MEYKQKLALVIAFYFSKYDKSAYKNLGYRSFSEAFREIGNILNVKPTSIKQMREQFDPYHENTRVGWYQRPLSRSRRDVMNQYGAFSEAALREIIFDILKTVQLGEQTNENYTKYISEIDDSSISKEGSSLYTSRGITGQLAEELFLTLYNKGEIKGFTVHLKDTRLNGTGYDFEMISEPYYVFEIKGLRAKKGSVIFTDHEWKVAQNLREKYFVILLSNLDEDVKISVVQNPSEVLRPNLRMYPIMQVNWQVETDYFVELGRNK